MQEALESFERAARWYCQEKRLDPDETVSSGGMALPRGKTVAAILREHELRDNAVKVWRGLSL
jgi:hypothetical protein